MFFTLIRDILKVLQSDISPKQIAFGAVLGVFFGLVPGLLMKCLIFALIMILRVNIGSAFVSSAVFALIGLCTDPIADKIGYFILNKDSLISFWTYLYNMPLAAFTKFNNTIVMGNMALSFIFFIPVYFLSTIILTYYRTHLRDRVAKWRIIKLLTASSLSYKILK
ncbi:MAG: TIGR03546 family protein [Endomicrobium sp.]|nr:TIGR03546 family protein [Endomicrobium sp.]